MKKITGLIIGLTLNFLLSAFFVNSVHATTVTLTPDRFYSINRNGDNTSTPTSIARWDGNGNWGKWLSHWDFSSVPSGSFIASVTLRANQRNWAQGGSYAYVFRLKSGNENWTTSATWTTKDGVNPWIGSDGAGTPDVDYYSVPLGLVYTPSGDYSVSLDPQLFQNVIDNNESLLFTALDDGNGWSTGPLIVNPSAYEELVIDYTSSPPTTPSPTPLPTPTPTPPPGVDYAVNFNTSGYLETSTTLSVGPSFSIEFTWQDPWPQNPNPPHNVIGPNDWGSDSGGVGLFQFVNNANNPQSNGPILYGGISWNGRMFLYDLVQGYTFSVPVPYGWSQGQIYHLYFARDTNGMLYFGQNGKMMHVQRSPDIGGSGYFYLGTGYTARSLGIINEFRLSNNVRYTTDYNPPTYFTPDENTIFLAHMDEGIGLTTADASGNGYVFEFKEDASWVPGSSQVVALSPAKIWVGLRRNWDIGLRLDFLAEVYKESTLVGSGELSSVPAGRRGFRNARLNTIPLTLFTPVGIQPGDSLSAKIYVRNACIGSLRNSGTARLWYNDSDANSQLGITIDAASNSYYLLDNFLLGLVPGLGPKRTIDVVVGERCSPFKLFGTWMITM